MYRLRTCGGKLKVEHSIIDGLKPILAKVLSSPLGGSISLIVPGRIAPVKNAKGPAVHLRLTVPLSGAAAGWKGIALSQGARQEVFFSTDLPKDDLAKALAEAGAVCL